MKQLSAILKFEYFNYIKNKAFIAITAVVVLIVAGVLFFPKISDLFKSETTQQPGQGEKQVVALVDKVRADKEATRKLFSDYIQNFKWELSDADVETLKTDVDSGKYNSAVIIESPTKYTFVTKSVGLYDNATYMLDMAMQAKYRADALKLLGVPEEDMWKIVSANVESTTIETGKNQQQNFFYTYVLMFMLYMAILLYGQFVAMSVAAEKSSRAMELLITSAKPVNLMFGKVIGSGLAGLTQMAVILLSGFLFYNLNKDSWGGNDVIQSIFGMPLEIMLYTILFFFLGYFIYSFMYGALGSLASRTEDINTSILPVTFLFVIAFFVSMYGLGGGNVNNPLMIACSYIPFTSPMAMFVRICMSEVPAYEIILSVAILVLSTLGIGYLSAAIYRIGVLLYGKPPKLGELFKMLKRAR